MTATTATTATVEAATAGAATVPLTPKAFVRQLRRLVKTGTPWDVAAFYAQHGAAVAPLLRGRDRVLVADVMHVVDTVTDWKPSPEMLRPPSTSESPPAATGRPAETDGAAARAAGSRGVVARTDGSRRLNGAAHAR